MYEKDKTLLLVATASALPNNLSCKLLDPSRVSEAVGVIHGGYINVIPLRAADNAAQYIPCTDTAERYSASVQQVSVFIFHFDHSTFNLNYQNEEKEPTNY